MAREYDQELTSAPQPEAERKSVERSAETGQGTGPREGTGSGDQARLEESPDAAQEAAPGERPEDLGDRVLPGESRDETDPRDEPNEPSESDSDAEEEALDDEDKEEADWADENENEDEDEDDNTDLTRELTNDFYHTDQLSEETHVGDGGPDDPWSTVTLHPDGYAFGRYDELCSFRDASSEGGAAFEAHHLIEHQYMDKFGVGRDEGVAVLLEFEDHRGQHDSITQDLKEQKSSMDLAKADIMEVYNAHQAEYQDRPSWQDKVDGFIVEHADQIREAYNNPTAELKELNGRDWETRRDETMAFLDDLEKRHRQG